MNKSLEKNISQLTEHHFSGKELDSLNLSNPQLRARACAFGNDSIAPINWSGWSEMSKVSPVSGLELEGSLGKAKFVLRIPDDWNGQLVSLATPATRNQYSLDLLFLNFLLEKRFAVLSSDKGTPGHADPEDLLAPIKNAMLNETLMTWHEHYAAITQWAQNFLSTQHLTQSKRERNLQVFDHVVPTYGIGVSNGGYVLRYALENDDPENPCFIAGLDWEGVLWDYDSNLISSMQRVIDLYLKLQESSDPRFRHALIDHGLPDCPMELWQYYYEIYWAPVFHIYRDVIDTAYQDRLNWSDYFKLDAENHRIKTHDKKIASYSWQERQMYCRDALDKVVNTGKIHVPMISLVGTWDCLTVPKIHGEAYAELVKKAGCSALHRLYSVTKGTHIDSLAGSPWDVTGQIKPILPHAQDCFEILLTWVKDKQVPAQHCTF